MQTPKGIYRRFVEFEEKCAGVYLRLASRFSCENPKLSALWLDMAVEEKQHAGLLQFCVAQRLFAPKLPSDSEVRKFAALFKTLEKRASDPKITVDDAFLLASEMEGSEFNAIYCHLTTPLHPSIYLLKRKIVTSPFTHLSSLVAAGKDFGLGPKTLKKLGQLETSRPKVDFSA